MSKEMYSLAHVDYNHPEVSFVQNLIEIETAPAHLSDEIPIQELRLMEQQFEEYCMEREAV